MCSGPPDLKRQLARKTRIVRLACCSEQCDTRIDQADRGTKKQLQQQRRSGDEERQFKWPFKVQKDERIQSPMLQAICSI